MTTLNDLIVTDDVTDNLATYNNRFLGSMFSADNTNTETITATKELADSDCIYQVITASGASRTVELPPEGTANHPHLIYNTSAANTIPVKDDSGVTTFITLAADEWALFFPVSGEAWQLVSSSQNLGVTATSTTTFTNKTLIATSNVIAEITTTASSATPTPTGGSLRNIFTVTALAAGATFGAPTGTPANGNMLLMRVKDNGTSQTLAYNAIYRAIGLTLPTATTISKTIYYLAIYNSADSKWDVVSVASEA